MSDNKSYVKLVNKEAVIASLQSLQSDMQEQVLAALTETGKDIKKHLKQKVGISGGGAPSAPGSPPARLTGELRNSVYAKVDPPELGKPITLRIAVRAFFARMVEFGTSKMAARPFFYSGIAEKVPALRASVKAALAAVIADRNRRTHKYSVRRRHWTADQLESAIMRDKQKLTDFDSTFGGGE